MRRLTWIWLLSACLWAQDADRSFTGTWKLKAENREFGTLPVPPADVLEIRHEGNTVHCIATPAGAPENACSLKDDGSETKIAVSGGGISTRAKWEGRSLLVNSILSGPRSYTRMDRWTLSRDRNTLSIRREIVGRYRQAESTLIYERVASTSKTPAPVTASSGTGPMRHGRHMLTPVPPVTYSKLDGMDAPVHKGRDAVVIGLCYEDADRTYVEVSVKNESQHTITLPPDFIAVEQSGRAIARTDAVRASEHVNRTALRAFTPSPTGRHPKTGQPLYDRSRVEEQARRHIAIQEQESAFAALVLATAQTGAIAIEPGEEHMLVCTFAPRQDRTAPLTVTVRAGQDVLRFSFQD